MARAKKSAAKKPGRGIQAALAKVRMLCMDVDGVLTDGGMYYSEAGDEMKRFQVKDGMGIKMLQAAGVITAIVTREKTAIVDRRFTKLTVPEIHQGVEDKLNDITRLARKYGLTLAQIAYVGDDINDVDALKAVGFSAAPADAMPCALDAVLYVCAHNGGDGAVREIADLILAAR